MPRRKQHCPKRMSEDGLPSSTSDDVGGPNPNKDDDEDDSSGSDEVSPSPRLPVTRLPVSLDDEDDEDGKMVVDEDDDDEQEVLDFSVKSKVDKKRPPEADADAAKDNHHRPKRPKTSPSATFVSPLDLTVKKDIISGHHHHRHHHSSSNSTKHSSQVIPSQSATTHPLAASLVSSLSRNFLAARSPFTASAAALMAKLSPSPPTQVTSPTKSSPSSSRRSSTSSLPAANGQNDLPTKKTGKGLFTGPSGLLQKSPGSGHGRQNPWQTQWINRSSEQTRDVFTCVWCKESFRSLQEMTLHMKESPRCGMAGIQHAQATASSVTSVNPPPTATVTNGLSTPPKSSSHSKGQVMSSSSATSSLHHHHHQVPSSSSATSSNVTSTSKDASGHPLSNAVLAKNNVTLPRKLVRGQDVWLGRGAEQTRQILKCMWCAQSFKSLDEMTRHMRVTQHYTNIISQEQIISWRTPEDKVTQAAVNAVLTCKVCDEAFGSLKELSYHMVKNSHYKEHILRSITEGGHGRRRQTRERRKKSLPVRKLLELERMEMTSTPGQSKPASSTTTTAKDDQQTMSSPSGSSRMTPTPPSTSSTPKIDVKSESGGKSPIRSPDDSDHSFSPKPEVDSPKTKVKEEEPEVDSHQMQKTNSGKAKSKSQVVKTEATSGQAASSASLFALQSLIDKSFDMKLPGLPVSQRSSSESPHLDRHPKKVNGSKRGHDHHHKLSPPKMATTSMSTVEKWMALAKERDGNTSNNLWSSSLSSSSEPSSWLGSDDESQGVTLKATIKPEVSTSLRVDSPTSTTSSTREDPTSPLPVVKSKSSKYKDVKRKSSDVCGPSATSGLATSSQVNEEEERREEIERLKRNATRIAEPEVSDKKSPGPSSSSGATCAANATSASSASLSALEQLIEKSFDSKKGKNAPTGFLQRLGIDEEVCPPWQPGALGAALAAGFGAAGLPFMAGGPFQPWMSLLPKGPTDSRSSSSSSSPVMTRTTSKNGSVSSSPPV